MKLLKNHPILVFVVIFFLFPLCVLFTLVLISFIRFFSAPVIDDPIAFGKSFDITKFKVVQLKEEDGVSIIGDEISYRKSMFFPYIPIYSVKTLSNCPEEDRHMYIDDLWSIFWVKVNGCSSENEFPSKFFGPFRSKEPLSDVLNFEPVKKVNN